MKPKVYVKTFGCRTNLFDSQVMLSSLKDFDITEAEHEADIIIVNSCTVTNGADVGVRGYINGIEKKGKAKVYLTGCGAHTKGESLFENKKVFGVFGQSEKKKINTLLKEQSRFYELGDLNFVDDAIVEEFVGKSRAFIKIQEGCDFRCSYCIIPFVRGDSRSLDEEKILEQVATLAINGFGEFILTGTNVGSYGHRSDTNLVRLLKRMSQIRGVRRIRLGSIEPVQFTDEFKEILDEPWLEKHLHIALQHTSPTMLKLMNRRNKFKEDIKLFQELREHGFALGTDFIVGHPGESDTIWAEAMRHLNDLPLTHVHAFSYSKRDGTPSATLKPEINGAIAKRRLKELTDLVDLKNRAFRKAFEQQPLDVLIESEKEGKFYGLDQYFNKVIITSKDDLVGNWLSVEDYEVREDGNHAKF